MVNRLKFPDQIVADKVFSKDNLTAMWNAIDWAHVREAVFRQQCRIARAALEKKVDEIPQLQHVLVNTDEAKALAVWEIMHRKSRNTPGVDGIVWETPAQWMSAALHLNNGDYESIPLRRFFIPKTSGKLRPIGISAMQDRAMQMLYNFALQPVAETWGDPHSFGYRMFRSAKDACTAIRDFLAEGKGGEIWVLDADITGCFDNIRHDWLLKHIPVPREVLRQVLKSGYMYEGRFYPTCRGVPQGGIISPVLANMALDGLEPRLMKAFGQPDGCSGEIQVHGPGLRFIRYADDFVVLTFSRSVAEEAWDEINAFLKPRGLSLSVEKTRVVPASRGFSFLHWRFCRGNENIPVRPSDASVYHMRQAIQEFFSKREFQTPDELIERLNPLLRGYAFYHREVDAGNLFRSLDEDIRQNIFGVLDDWFPNDEPGSVKKRFFAPCTTTHSRFHTVKGDLYLMSSTPTGPRALIETDRNAFLDRDYFLQREIQGDSLDREVRRERMRCREEGKRYGIPEYW
jgi:RNA-directed DNA polymerase